MGNRRARRYGYRRVFGFEQLLGITDFIWFGFQHEIARRFVDAEALKRIGNSPEIDSEFPILSDSLFDEAYEKVSQLAGTLSDAIAHHMMWNNSPWLDASLETISTHFRTFLEQSDIDSFGFEESQLELVDVLLEDLGNWDPEFDLTLSDSEKLGQLVNFLAWATVQSMNIQFNLERDLPSTEVGIEFEKLDKELARYVEMAADETDSKLSGQLSTKVVTQPMSFNQLYLKESLDAALVLISQNALELAEKMDISLHDCFELETMLAPPFRETCGTANLKAARCGNPPGDIRASFRPRFG